MTNGKGNVFGIITRRRVLVLTGMRGTGMAKKKRLKEGALHEGIYGLGREY